MVRYAVFFLLIFQVGCRKFLEIEAPPNSVFSSSVFSNDALATSAVLAVYNGMIESSSARFASGSGSISLLCGLSSDELQNFSIDISQREFYTNSLQANNGSSYLLWVNLYKYIYDANAILEGLNESKQLSLPVKKQLEGEAKFIRGLCLFYLVNLYGDVPIVLSTDYKVNSTAGKRSAGEVYRQIVLDLSDAKEGLDGNYLDAANVKTTERVRPTKYVASALLARIYLYIKDYANAEKEADLVINQTSMFSLLELNEVFLKNSKEVIWSLQPVIPQYNSYDGLTFILVSVPSNVSLSDHQVNVFEPGDRRKISWIGSVTSAGQTYYFPFKYKVRFLPTAATPPTEYHVVMRLAEQYLIRAEAKINLGRINEGVSDLNILRNRARATPTTTVPNPLPLLSESLSKEEALTALEYERTAELFTEWGHRWFDLKRSGKADVIMPAITHLKGGEWKPEYKLYPIPQTEIDRNPNLQPQNPGYN